jgi:hypothetical protein
MTKEEIIFQVVQLAILLAGGVGPMLYATFRLRSLLKDFPPHRHISGGGQILYPKGYEPGDLEMRF